MLNSLRLLAPVLVPSWRFFDTITASPRIEVLPLGPDGAPRGEWREFRPRPQRLPLRSFLVRLLWNPGWNETLYLTSCAERLLEEESTFRVAEIARRIAAILDPEETPSFQFRLVLVSRAGEVLQKEVAYLSPRQIVVPR